jgi:virginiamycin A acetyltransferase
MFGDMMVASNVRRQVALISGRRERAKWTAAGLRLDEGARIAPHSLVGTRVHLGQYAAINGPAVLKGPGDIEVGAYCAIGDEFRVITASHRTDHPNIQIGVHRQNGFIELQEHSNVTIGPACWIGDRVTVLPGTAVGAGSVLAAGAVVRGFVEPYTIVGGVPAKQLKERCSRAVASALNDIAWWDWTPARIARNKEFFEADIARVSPDELVTLVR